MSNAVGIQLGRLEAIQQLNEIVTEIEYGTGK